MFVWLASYPKSGNTLTRSMLASYFFTEDGQYDFNLLKNILQFPEIGLFKKLGINISNEKEVIKNYVRAQELVNKKNSIQFMKTHSYLFNIDNNPFTDLNNSLGVIYIVRDPRNVLISAANHNQKTYEEIADHMINGNILKKKDSSNSIVYAGTWSGNFNSWKSFKTLNKYLLIKYEDLINDKEKYFFKILKFIYDLKKTKFVINKKKFRNVILNTDFKFMQKLEDENGFEESMVNEYTGKKVKFFNLGAKTDWKNLLNSELQNKIQKNFQKEMIELNYL